jgi:hypothetical protein
MKTILAAAFALGLATTGALAQTEPPSPEGAPPTSGASMRAANQELIAKCRAEAKEQGAKGPAMKEAVNACVAKKNPTLAKRIGCMQQAKAQGIANKDQIRAFVKSCIGRQE